MVKFIINKVKKTLGSKPAAAAAPQASASEKSDEKKSEKKKQDTESKDDSPKPEHKHSGNQPRKSNSRSRRGGGNKGGNKDGNESETASASSEEKGHAKSEEGGDQQDNQQPQEQQKQQKQQRRRSGNRSRSSSDRGERSDDGSNPSGERKKSSGNRNQKTGDRKKSSGNRQKNSPATPRNPKLDKTEWNPADYVVAEVEGKTRFHDLDLPEPIMHALYDLKFEYCTPIQAGILPQIMGTEHDAMGKAQTGTGKTAAFLLSAFTRLLANPIEGKRPNGSPRVLVLAPTRELVLQIEEEAQLLGKYTGLRSLAVYGGLDYEKQKSILQNEVVDIVCATPGRLIDFNRSRVINLKQVEILTIDEADRMLDMGFIPDVKRIVGSTPHKDKRQTFFFSATFSQDVERLATQWTHEPVRVEIEPESVAADTVDQRVYLATDDEKLIIVYNLIQIEKPERVLIFANRRDQVRRLCETLERYGINSAILSGDVPQAKRVKTLARFKDGSVPVLVATDVAGRGIHVDGVSHVINYHLPEDAEDYVHRIGRTGRAGSAGHSISFASQFDAFVLPEIEKFIGRELKSVYPEEELMTPLPPAPPAKPRERRSGGHGGGNRSGGNRGRSGGGGNRSGSRGGSRGGSGNSGQRRSSGGGNRRSSSDKG
jgi:ATP-dependent RNA helicase RhlB